MMVSTTHTYAMYIHAHTQSVRVGYECMRKTGTLHCPSTPLLCLQSTLIIGTRQYLHIPTTQLEASSTTFPWVWVRTMGLNMVDRSRVS